MRPWSILGFFAGTRALFTHRNSLAYPKNSMHPSGAARAVTYSANEVKDILIHKYDFNVDIGPLKTIESRLREREQESAAREEPPRFTFKRQNAKDRHFRQSTYN